jgi:hypothetical protein
LANPNTIDPSYFQGAAGAPWWLPLLGNLNPMARAAIAGAGVLAPTPLNQGETVPFNARPSPSPAPMNPYEHRGIAPAPIDPYEIHPPPSAIAAANTPAQAGPATPTPPPRPIIDPKNVDLGYYRGGVGNARTPVYVPPGQGRIAPDIFRGLLAQRPT